MFRQLSKRFGHSKKQCNIEGKIVVIQSLGQSSPGKSASVQLFSSTQLDPKTGMGMLSEQAYLKDGKRTKLNGAKITTYKIELHLEPEFGIPGALLMKSNHQHAIFLQTATLRLLEIDRVVRFNCKSWIHPIRRTNTDAVFFSSACCYLPSQTPRALIRLRAEILASLRGDGTRERKEHDCIYEYDYYNDLSDLSKGPEQFKPVLGGSFHPYPRRLRTCPPQSVQDPSTIRSQKRVNLDVIVPPREQFAPEKQSDFMSNSIQAVVHFLVPEAKPSMFARGYKSSSIASFDEILDLFSSKRNYKVEGWLVENLKNLVSDDTLKAIARAIKEQPQQFPLPQIITEDILAWKNDEEFARQMLAGVNPTVIQSLETFPPQSKHGRSSIRASHIEQNLDGLTVAQAMSSKRIFILDHHDYLMPFLDKINTQDVFAYASRTLLFLREDATLMPLVIELSLPPCSPTTTEVTMLFFPAAHGSDAALWQLAKAHVAANDSAYHQLISHWLKTQIVIEPFIIASRRQLSLMHPIHQLLDPHFKDTLHVNALAHRILLGTKGILQKTLFTGKCSMELSAELYKDWRFDEQGLPADLLRRGMAYIDPEKPAGIQLLLEDYPYAADGLEIWNAISTWVRDYCSVFYKDNDSVNSDTELQAWWSEVLNVGHPNKRNENGWYKMTTLSDLTEALTILIWIASPLHSAVNHGQYGYSGYPPNRPTSCRKSIPLEGTPQFAEFLRDPDKYYLCMLPRRYEMSLGITLTAVLSQNISDEEYLGQRPPSNWTENKEVQQMFTKFKETLQEVGKHIMQRNRDPKFKNRWGPAKIPYRPLYPNAPKGKSRGGITRGGIPNSISI